MNDDLTPLLRNLPEPPPGPSLTAAVMARIEREAEREADVRPIAPAKPAIERRAWLFTFAGIALIVIVFANGWLTLGTSPDFTTSRIGSGRAMLVPVQGPAMWIVGIGLVIYLVGLFAPLRSDERN